MFIYFPKTSKRQTSNWASSQTVRSPMIAQFPQLLFHLGEAGCIASVLLHRDLDDFMSVSKATNLRWSTIGFWGPLWSEKKWKNLMFMITSSDIIVHQQQNLEMILEIAFFPFRTRSGMLRTGPGVRCDAQAGWLHHQQWPDPGRWTWQCDWSPNGSTPPRWMATKNWWTSWKWRSDQLRWSHSQLNRWIGDMKNWLVAPLLKSLPFTPV